MERSWPPPGLDALLEREAEWRVPCSLPHIFHHLARGWSLPANVERAPAAALALDPLPKTCSTPAPAREPSHSFSTHDTAIFHPSPPNPINISRPAGRGAKTENPHAEPFPRPRRPTTSTRHARRRHLGPPPGFLLPLLPPQRHTPEPTGQYSSAPSKMAPAAMSGMPGTKMHDDIDTTCVPALPSLAPLYPAGRLSQSRF